MSEREQNSTRRDADKDEVRIQHRRDDEVDATSSGAEGGLNTINDGIEKALKQADDNREAKR